MADKTIGGEGIHQDWRIDEKNNKQPKKNKTATNSSDSNKHKSNKTTVTNANSSNENK